MEVGDIVYYPFGRKEGVVIRIIDNNVVVAFPSREQTLSNYSLEETGRQIPPCPFKPGDKVKFKVDEWGWFRERPVTKKGTVDDVSIKVTSKSFYNITVSYLMENGYMYQSTTKTENELKKIH